MKLPVDYPSDDDVPYLRFFGPQFSHVYVALNPFIRAKGVPFQDPGDYLDDEVRKKIGQQGAGTSVFWSEIARLARLQSVKRVNRALRLTGSKRIRPELASARDTKALLDACKEHDVSLPDEGYPTPGMSLQIAEFLRRLGYSEFWAADHFVDSKLVEIERALEPNFSYPPQVYAADGELYITMEIDYHYALVCQTAASRRKADPADFFEGFDADETTNDYWGIGMNADE